MSAKGLKSIFSIGEDIISSEVGANNTIMFHLGDSSTGTAHSEAESWQHAGFASIPAKLTSGADPSAQAITINTSGYDIVIATRDTRYQKIYGDLKPGEACFYSPGGQGRALMKIDGSIFLYTTKDNTPDGDGMGLSIVPSADTVSLLNSKGYGFMANADGVYVIGPKGAMKITDDGAFLISTGGKAQVDGTSVVIGSTTVPVVNAALTGPTGIAGKASLKVLIE